MLSCKTYQFSPVNSQIQDVLFVLRKPPRGLCDRLQPGVILDVENTFWELPVLLLWPEMLEL